MINLLLIRQLHHNEAVIRNIRIQKEQVRIPDGVRSNVGTATFFRNGIKKKKKNHESEEDAVIFSVTKEPNITGLHYTDSNA